LPGWRRISSAARCAGGSDAPHESAVRNPVPRVTLGP
jgi:hypothetical protein